MRDSRGFTLLEVLVALGIFALVAASVLAASSRSLQNAARLEEKTLAMWVADNQLTELQLQDPAPGVGVQEGEVEFAGRTFAWQSSVQGTSDPGMQRIEVLVGLAQGRASEPLEDRVLARLAGFLGTQP